MLHYIKKEGFRNSNQKSMDENRESGNNIYEISKKPLLFWD